MSDCSILRLGPAGSAHVALLRAALVRRFGRDPPAPAPPAGDWLTFSNRYFDARVLLLGLRAPVPPSLPDAREDGVLLAFDASDPAPVPAALGPHHAAALRDGRCGDVVRLCLAVDARGDAAPAADAGAAEAAEGEYARRVLWCLDRGYEYVEVDATPAGLARGHEKRDKDGFARVVEALGAAMWSSHVMKPRGAGVVAAPAPVAALAPVASVAPVAAGTTAPATATGDAASRADDAERETAAVASLMRGMAEEAAPERGDAEGDARRQHRRDEATFLQLERTLAEAKRLRAASRTEAMSDRERRERAGDAAAKLMGLLDACGWEDGGSEEEEEGSHSSREEQ